MIWTISLTLIGLFSWKTKQSLSLDFPFVIWSQDIGQFHQNIITQKYYLAFPKRIEQVHSPQNDEKTTQITSVIVDEKRKIDNMSFAAKWK